MSDDEERDLRLVKTVSVIADRDEEIERLEKDRDALKMQLDLYVSEVDKLRENLRRIRQWCDAYPLDIFPEPDLKKARKLLEAGGMTLDSVSASSMRHVLKGIRKIIDQQE